MGWPQWVVIVLSILGLGINLAKHGEKRVTEYNVITHFVGVAIMWWLLYMGGFWNGG